MFKKVLIAEDSLVTSQGIAHFLKEIIIQVYQTQYTDDAFLKIKKSILDNEPFELVVTDLSFASDHREQVIKSGIELIAEIKQLQPQIKIIVFSVENNLSRVQNLINQKNIDAYVLKERNGITHLKKAINAVYNNEIYISPKIKHLLNEGEKIRADFSKTSTTVNNEMSKDSINIKKKEKGKIESDTNEISSKSNIETSIDKYSKVDLEHIIDSSKGNFYVINSHLARHTEVGKFYNDFSEENKSHKKYKDIVQMIESGDILISPDILREGKNKQLYSINKLGVVQKDSSSKNVLSIDWKLQKIETRFMASVNYNSSLISKPHREDLIKILSQINKLKLDSLINRIDTTSITKIIEVPGIKSDADSGTDHLNISQDVAAFARVIAAKSFKPPLAIALFGKWGSGKSFFMRKLKERIQILSSKKSELGFCEGIAHIHFNAWSYMDTNLWAGIITKIFEGLSNYINNEQNATYKLKQKIEETIAKELNITKNEISKLESGILNNEAKLKLLNDKRKDRNSLLKDKIKGIRNKTLYEIIKNTDSEFKIEEKITQAINENSTLKLNETTLKKIIPEKYWKNPEALYQQSKKTITFFKIFFNPKYIWKNLLWLVFICLLIIFTPPIIKYFLLLIDITDYSFSPSFITILSTTGIIIGRCINVYKTYQPLVASFWNIKKEYDLKKEEAIFNHKQEEKALELEIEKIKAELIDINHQINQTEEQKAELEFRKNNTLSTEVLKSFIEKRSNSLEYKKHLGLISTIRKDFEILSILFTEHIDELEASKKEEIEKFRGHFKHPLERIVLYIDDLDRCPEDRVIEVLEAVNLLMAYPLFVVVVGVDPRWVKNSLIKKHHLHFIKEEHSDTELIDSSSYLEKIFQIPFNLKAAKDDSVKNMIRALIDTQSPPLPIKSKLSQKKLKSNDNQNVKAKIDNKLESRNNLSEIETNPDKEPSIEEEIIETKEIVASISFSEKEVELLQEMSVIIGSSPRAIKRFINIYRIAKAHESFGYTNDEDMTEMLTVMFLLALPIGKFKNLAKIFYNQIADNSKESWILLKLMNDNINQEVLKSQFISIRDVISESGFKEILDQRVLLLNEHLPFIKRFAYDI